MQEWEVLFTDGTVERVHGNHSRLTDTVVVFSTILGGQETAVRTYPLVNVRRWSRVGD